MSECTLGHAGELRSHGIAISSLWPVLAARGVSDADRCAVEPGTREPSPDLFVD
ncbi:MAG: hypothetical protein KIT17_18740 [Rubrivivax sp.]|nr:hypothetical protein [Burkholderiales bacterium]MCW5635382.1 hypothetical protein [Rubrivivax sp.]